MLASRDLNGLWFVASAQRAMPSTVLDSAEAQRLFAVGGLGIAHQPHSSAHPRKVIEAHALYPDRRLRPARLRLFIDLTVEPRRSR